MEQHTASGQIFAEMSKMMGFQLGVILLYAFCLSTQVRYLILLLLLFSCACRPVFCTTLGCLLIHEVLLDYTETGHLHSVDFQMFYSNLYIFIRIFRIRKSLYSFYLGKMGYIVV